MDKKLDENADWHDWFERIDAMIASGHYDWAEDTLFSIGEWVEENEHITDKQKKAIQNIWSSV